MSSRRYMSPAATLRGLAICTSLFLVSGHTLAGGKSSPVTVSVTYEMSLPLPDKTPEDVSGALDSSRDMVYQRIHNECGQLLQHIASWCELTKLDIKHSVRSARRKGRDDQVSVRASARFEIELIKREESKPK